MTIPIDDWSISSTVRLSTTKKSWWRLPSCSKVDYSVKNFVLVTKKSCKEIEAFGRKVDMKSKEREEDERW